MLFVHPLLEWGSDGSYRSVRMANILFILVYVCVCVKYCEAATVSCFKC